MSIPGGIPEQRPRGQHAEFVMIDEFSEWHLTQEQVDKACEGLTWEPLYAVRDWDRWLPVANERPGLITRSIPEPDVIVESKS